MENNKMENYDLLGSHILKKSSFYDSISEYHKKSKSTSMQIFTGSTKSWARKDPDPDDLKKTKEYIEENKLNVFIHSIYLINLARPAEEIQSALTNLKWEFKYGPLMGIKGVVVHVGKSLKMKKEIAIQNMKDNIISLFPHISEECPFLLETPAGQGTELFTKISELAQFYKDLTSNTEHKNKIKICIDTCHVFASGYEPDEYIEQWIKTFPESLVLIHFNDSKEIKGSKKDRHALYGKGHIGLEKMTKILYFGIDNKIPMVIE